MKASWESSIHSQVWTAPRPTLLEQTCLSSMQTQDSGKLVYHRSQQNLLPLSLHLGGSASTAYPEHFQKWISQVLEGTDCALCQIDDTLVFGKTTEEHDKHLEATLQKLQEANLTLNKEKWEFSKPLVEYIASIIDSEGVCIDPKKVEAILAMETPKISLV